MAPLDFYIYVVISFLGVAYPLLLQVIARLDEKYSSDIIVQLFEKELEGKLFTALLFSSVGAVVLWTLKLEPLIQIEGVNYLINHSADLLVAASSTALIITFSFFVNKIIIYYTPAKFISYLINSHKTSNGAPYFFQALSEIFLLAIRTNSRSQSSTISKYFYSAFSKVREENSDSPVEYPDEYYDIVHKSIEELAILKEKRNYALEYRTAGGVWLLGEVYTREISNKTYSWIWRNIKLITNYRIGDMIIYHWETANQYFIYNLEQINPDYHISEGEYKIKNKSKIEDRNSQREEFIEFHFAVGGLLLYQKMHDSINRMFSYTTSDPPQYDLLPSSMDEIFSFFFKLNDPHSKKYYWISKKYPFPGLEGARADKVIKKWISLYMGVLFLRQYILSPHLSTIRPMAMPQIPDGQVEKKEWINGLRFFKEVVFGLLGNKSLLNNFGLDIITKNWCSDSNKTYPIEFIEEFKKKLEEAYEEKAISIHISPQKEAKFKASSKQKIEATFSVYKSLDNHSDLGEDNEQWYIGGQRTVYFKDAFSEEPEVNYMNYDSFLGEVLCKRIVEGVPQTFLLKKTKSYLLKSEDIFKAIDRLELDDSYIIVCFGIDYDFFKKGKNVKELSEEKYKNKPVLFFRGSRLVRSSIFILKKQDLPKITTEQINREIINKYGLDDIGQNLHLYASVVDLNEKNNEDILKEQEKISEKTEDELRKSVLLSLLVNIIISWKKKVEVIQIIQYNKYVDKGLPGDIDEITPLNQSK